MQNKLLAVVMFCWLLTCMPGLGCGGNAADRPPEQVSQKVPSEDWPAGVTTVNAAVEGLVYPGENTQAGYGQTIHGEGQDTYSVTLRIPEEGLEGVADYYRGLLQDTPGYHRTHRVGPAKEEVYLFNATWKGNTVNIQVTPDTADPAYTLVIITIGIPGTVEETGQGAL